jgi:quercetin dioxygenase-like cupin family protein
VGVDLICLGPGQAMPNHVHARPQVLIALKGRGGVDASDGDAISGTSELAEGDTILLSPGVQRRFTNVAPSGWVILSVLPSKPPSHADGRNPVSASGLGALGDIQSLLAKVHYTPPPTTFVRERIWGRVAILDRITGNIVADIPARRSHFST